ncbi:MAG: dihydroneopterin aldolase [Gammaproteobacteria bacterium]|nr:dihydroneopterin aldolase [Gammaproteobacteria bacterium]|tara:strand:- start:4159 stop:4512 length:354 start_codon:yes stop_codon:yes gene_type:complete
MDTIFIKELCIETIIGIYDWEREIKQFVCIDLELSTEIKKASDTDDITNTVDYKAVAKRVKSFVEESKFLLIEALAEQTVNIILKEFNVSHVKGRFSKPGAVTGSKEVGVIIERGKK